MAIALTRFSQWMLRGDQRQKPKPKPIKPCRSPTSAATPPSTDFPSGFCESEPVKLNFSNLPPSCCSSSTSSRRMRKRHSTSKDKHKRLDCEHDMVIVPSDGGACISGSESDGSDWSIGWLEPHPHDFCTSDAESEDSFAVLVPCYRPARANPLLEAPTAAFGFGVGLRIPTREDFSASDNNEFLQHWLSSLASDLLV